MVQSDPEPSERSSARAEHQLWCVGETSLLPPLLVFLLQIPLETGIFFSFLFFLSLYIISFGASAATGTSLNRLVPTDSCLLFYPFYFWPIWTLSGGFPALVLKAAGVTRPSFPPFCLRNERKSRNSHVWMNKRPESEGTDAGMEEITLPEATCKSALIPLSCLKKKMHECFVIHVLYHIVTEWFERNLVRLDVEK